MGPSVAPCQILLANFCLRQPSVSKMPFPGFPGKTAACSTQHQAKNNAETGEVKKF